MTAGTLPWLLRHELRLAIRGMKLSSVAVWLSLLALVVIFHVVGGFLAFGLGRGGGAALPGVSAMVAALASCFMAGTAVYRAMDTIYSRGDYDLLLSSPLAPRVILPARALAVAAGTLLFPASVLLPIANMGAVFGHANWLAAYLALPALALLVTAIALLAALGLVRWVGVRRARVAGQALAAFTGFLMAMAGQIPQLIGTRMDWMGGAGLHGPLAAILLFPGRALLGDPLALLILLVVCTGVFAGVTVRWGPAFIAAATAAAGATTPRARAPDRALRFQDRLGPLLRRKEWRLMLRHPQLALLLFQQMSGAIILVISMQRQWRAEPQVLTALVVPMAALAAGTLAKLALADGASDLINAAPVPAERLRWAKVQAAILPPLAVVALVAALAAPLGLWGTLTILSCGIAATGSAVVASLWVQPMTGAAMQQMLKPRKGAGAKVVGRTLLETLMSYGWMATAVLMLHHDLYALLVAGGLMGLVAILRTPL
ncbi:hypothetical protein [Nitrospirillum iridis]|uniref:ABC-2 type transport system permease protein n=1 Tax=Nitrospirillum iridis TaxID=765888 RepID=A0A7X0AWN0_9PROT|nr:hypothetical protein [Nitrospirillum iridis]MBB6250661.1 ABC-2 type transport system permease protein [Nitrospirillum iridis]